MKNRKLVKILATVISCLLLVGAVIGFSVSATAAAPEIEYKNLAYEGAVQVVYYVNTGDVAEGNTVKLATWMAADKSDLVMKDAEAFTKFVGETEYTIFASEGIAPKMMRDTVYAQTVLFDAEGNELDRGEVVEYSVYTYVSNRLNKGATADQRALYHALVDYGASVQKVLGYKTYSLANDMFYDYANVSKQNEALRNGSPYTTENGLIKTITIAGDDGEYVLSYIGNTSAFASVAGDTYTYDSHFRITAITKDGGAADAALIGGATYVVGDKVPNSVLATDGNTSKSSIHFVPQGTAAKTGDITAMFETNVVATGTDGTFGIYLGVRKSNNVFYHNANGTYPIYIQVFESSIKVNGVTVAKNGEAFTLRATSAYKSLGVYDITLYANGVEVFKKEVNHSDNISTTSVGLDLVAFRNVHSTSSAPHEANATLVFSATTYVQYKTFDLPNAQGTNAVKPVTDSGTTGAQSGSGVVSTATATLDGKQVTYEVRFANMWDEATQTFTIARGLYITAIEGADYITLDGKQIGVGDGIWRDHVVSYVESYAKITPMEAMRTEEGLVFQLKTDMVIESNTSSGNSSYSNNLFMGINGKDSNYITIKDNGGNIVFDSVDTGAQFGKLFELVIRGYETETAGSYLMKYYVNGFLVTTKTITAAPASVHFKTYSQTADMKVMLMNTYCDSYYVPAEQVAGVNPYTYTTSIGNGERAEALADIYINVDGSGVGSIGTADSHTHVITYVNTTKNGVNADGSWTHGKSNLIRSIKTSDGDELASLKIGSTTYTVGSILPKAFLGGTYSGTWFGEARLDAIAAGERSDKLRLVFDTTAVYTSKDSSGASYINLQVGAITDKLFRGSNILIASNANGYVTVAGVVTNAKVGEEFNLHVEAYESETEGSVDVKVIVNGKIVSETTQILANSTNTATTNVPNAVYWTSGTSTIRDAVITLSDTTLDKYTAAAAE